MYSRRVRAVWSSDTEAECIRLPDVPERTIEASQSVEAERIRFDPDKLTPYAAALWASRLPEPLRLSHKKGLDMSFYEHSTISNVLLHIAAVKGQFSVTGRNDFAEYTQASGASAPAIFYRFLAGEIIESKLAESDSEEEWKKLAQFLGMLGRLPGQSFRAATQPRDYVTSVWVDCPRYRLPHTYRSMSLPALVQDALDQLYSNFGIVPMSTAPNGLFQKETTRSGIWMPSEYFKHVNLTSVRQVYGPLSYSGLRYIPIRPNGLVPLRLLKAAAMAISARAVDYLAMMEKAPSKDMLQYMKLVTAQWSPHVREFVNHRTVDQGMSISANQEWALIFTFRAIITDMLKTDETNVARAISDLDLTGKQMYFYRLVYDMVAEALGLDPDICRAHDLRLVTMPSSHQIGLLRKDVELDALWKVDQPNNDNDIITVCIQRTASEGNRLLLEADKVATADTPHSYRVFGIWVPTMDTSFPDISAIVHEAEDDADAFLV